MKIDPYSPIWDEYRKILHIDLDAFFASVEQRDNPSLRGLPIAVGLNQARGVVASCSYEARKFGVHSAQPSHLAAKLCPNLIFVKGRMPVYKEASENILEIFRRYTDIIEPVSIDEAFLDVTHNRLNLRFGVDCAKAIKRDIKKEVGLVASAGVSYNKFLAKIASDWKKPNGLFVIHPARAQNFIDQLPVKAIWGVGPVTQKKMESLNIRTCSDLRSQSLFFLTEHFGKAGLSYYNYARGIDERPLRTNRIRKQVSAEITFSHDLSSQNEIHEGVSRVVCQLKERMDKRKFRGFTLTLKIRLSDFSTFSRSHTFEHILEDPQEIYEQSLALLTKLDLQKKVRLIGIGIGSPLDVEQQDLLPFLDF